MHWPNLVGLWRAEAWPAGSVGHGTLGRALPPSWAHLQPGLGWDMSDRAPKGAAGTPPWGRRARCQSPCTQPQVAEKRGKRRCVRDTQTQHFNNTNQDWSTLFRFSDALPLWLKTYYSIRIPHYPSTSPDQVSWYRHAACSPSLKGMSHVGIKTFVSPHVNLG